MVLLLQMHGPKSLTTFHELHENTISGHTQKINNGEKEKLMILKHICN